MERIAINARRPVATYSIVAHCNDTGQLGVGVQSHWFSVGGIVSWAESGVGAVATQAFADPGYGPIGLELMRSGMHAQSALESALVGDSAAERRQVSYVSADGGTAVHTGESCIAEAGHIKGDGFTVQANMMARNTVWDAMAAAYEASSGDLEERMMVALEAAEAEGGDIRGKQSAAILVVGGEPSGKPWNDRIFDLRVEDHPEPLGEMRRLIRLQRAYNEMTAGDDALAQDNIPAALRHYAKAERSVPEIVEMPFWKAVGLVGAGHVDDALSVFTDVFQREPVWRDLIPRLVDSKILERDPDVIDQIMTC